VRVQTYTWPPSGVTAAPTARTLPRRELGQRACDRFDHAGAPGVDHRQRPVLAVGDVDEAIVGSDGEVAEQSAAEDRGRDGAAGEVDYRADG
jgi:hypothetical protein